VTTNWNEYFFELQERAFNKLVYSFNKGVIKAGDKTFFIQVNEMVLSYYDPYRSNELFQQEILSMFQFYYNLDKTQAVNAIIEAIPDIKRNSLKQMKRIIEQEWHQYNYRFKAINILRRIVGKEPYGIIHTSGDTINEDGTGYTNTGIEGSPAPDFVNIVNERLVVKLLVVHMVKERYKNFLKQMGEKQQGYFSDDKGDTTERSDIKSDLKWLGKDGTEFSHFAYALFNAGKITNETGEVTKAVEELARLLNFDLSKHWQSNRSKSINNTDKAEDLAIFKDLTTAHREQIEEVIKNREKRK
jgi:hypothetical protein